MGTAPTQPAPGIPCCVQPELGILFHRPWGWARGWVHRGVEWKRTPGNFPLFSMEFLPLCQSEPRLKQSRSFGVVSLCIPCWSLPAPGPGELCGVLGSRIRGWTLPFPTFLTPSCHQPFQRDGPGPNLPVHPRAALGHGAVLGKCVAEGKNIFKNHYLSNSLVSPSPAAAQPPLYVQNNSLKVTLTPSCIPIPCSACFLWEKDAQIISLHLRNSSATRQSPQYCAKPRPRPLPLLSFSDGNSCPE